MNEAFNTYGSRKMPTGKKKPEGKRLLGRGRRRWEGDIEMNLK
jgi:hypothetical protein